MNNGFGHSITKNLSAGGTISGDLTITGDLTVNPGSSTYSYDEAIYGNVMYLDSEVAHGMTGLGLTNAYGSIDQLHTDNGGVRIRGMSDAAAGIGVQIYGTIGVTDPTDAVPAVEIRGSKKSGTSHQALAAAETVFQVGNLGTDLVTVLGSGNVGIGTASPAVTLNIKGATNIEAPTLGTAAGGFLLHHTDANYGLNMGVGNSGNSWIQAHRVDSTGTAYNLNLQPSGGNVGIGVSPSSVLDVVGTNGLIRIADNATNSTRKYARITVPHYTNSEEPMGIIVADAQDNSATAILNIGGGSSVTNAFTKLIFYTAANNTTVTGTERFIIDNNSRISLTNNDAGGTGGSDGLSANTIFGYLAGEDIADTGVDNTYFGHKAGSNNATGDDNVFIGSNAGKGAHGNSNSHNVGVGSNALLAVTTGTGNVALGSGALDGTDDGHNNVAIGYGALSANVGDGSVAIGQGAGAAYTANQLVAIGQGAANSCTNVGNTAIGHMAMNQHTTGARNTAIGFGAMDGTGQDDAPTSTDNVFIGYDAGGGAWDDGADSTDDSNFNVGIGNYTMDAAMDGALYNTAVGYDTLTDLTTGQYNTTVGYSAGAIGAASDITTGTQNTLIGAMTRATAASTANCTAIGYLTIAQAANTVTLGNASVTDIYMAQDSGALVHCAGVNFPDTFANSADVNVLDDYEEGTWTPTFVIETGSNFSYDTQSGFYTKIGNVVHAWCHLQIDKTAGTNNISVQSWPFAAHNDGQSKNFPILISNYALADGMTYGQFYVNTSIMFLGHLPENAAIDPDNNGALLDNTTNITIDINITYRTDE